MGKSNLTTRQWQLYKYLKEHYCNKYISKKEIAEQVGYGWDNDSERNGRDIEKDIQALRDSDIIQKIIISNNEGYKLANKEEAIDYLRRYWLSKAKELVRFNKLRKKAGLDKQMRLTWNQERDTIEAFME